MLRAMLKTFACARCGNSFERKNCPSRPPKFCSRLCASAKKAEEMAADHSRWETPAQAAAARRNLEKSRTAPAMREYLESDRNPFKGKDAEAIRARAHETGRKRGFPELRDGNGELTTPQVLLLKLLGSEFTPECSVSLGRRQPGFPTCYKVDLGCPRLKLAVELDGNSHRSKQRQALDAKKDAKLGSLGWAVLRFSNTEVLKNPSGICQQIRETMSRLES